MIYLLLALYLSLNPVPVITLQRTACFGECPVYKISIYEDGRVEFEGKEFVKTVGKAEGTISKSALEDLIREFEKIDYFNLDENYGEGNKKCRELWTDNPTATTSLNWKDQKKTVHHYYGCRGSAILDQLTDLENKIDKTVHTERWIK
jgi:uncharacterized protein DUF6438